MLDTNNQSQQTPSHRKRDSQGTIPREILPIDNDTIHEHNPPVRANNWELRSGGHVLQVRRDFADGEHATTGRSRRERTREHEGDEVGLGGIGVEDLV